jgi:hypothetical protein
VSSLGLCREGVSRQDIRSDPNQTLAEILAAVQPCDRLALPELFDTAELAQAAGIQRRLAQQMTYCLRAMGVLTTAGKRSGAVVHRRAA